MIIPMRLELQYLSFGPRTHGQALAAMTDGLMR